MSAAPGSNRERWAMPLLLVGALLIRLFDLGRRSVWTDEGSTWTAASAPLRELLRLCAQKDASPPLFYLLTALVIRIRDDEAHLRMVSALASVALVWLTYRLARRFVPRGPARGAALLTAISPYQLMFAQEARTYTLVACFTVAAFVLFLRAADSGRARAWVPYVLVATLGLYTQSIALLGHGVEAAVVVLVPSARRRIAPWLLAQVAILLLYLPWLFVSMTQMGRLSHSHWYVETPDAHGVFQVLRAVFLAPVALVTAPLHSAVPGLDAWLPRRLAEVLLLAVSGIPLAATLTGLTARDGRGAATRIAWLGLALPLAAVYAVSLRTPLWLPRYFVFLTPFLAMLLAIGIECLRPRALRIAWMVALVAISLYGCVRYTLDYDKERWREVVRAIANASAGQRAAALVTFDIDPFRFYATKLAQPIDALEVSHPAVPFASEYTERQLDELEGTARARTRAFDDVWVVIRSPNSAVRREVARRAERAAAADGRRLVGRWTWDAPGGPLRVARFRRG